jgi:hypothetical protein
VEAKPIDTTRSVMGFASLYPSFCNGPRLVNPFCVVRSPGSRFCTGSAQGRHLMGLEEDKVGQSTFRVVTSHWMGNGLT